MNTPIMTVVPHPGATLPYSEFSGFNKVPNVVTLLLLKSLLVFEVVPVAIAFFFYDGMSLLSVR